MAKWRQRQNIKEIAPHQIQAKVVQRQNSIVQKLILKVACYIRVMFFFLNFPEISKQFDLCLRSPMFEWIRLVIYCRNLDLIHIRHHDSETYTNKLLSKIRRKFEPSIPTQIWQYRWPTLISAIFCMNIYP